MTFNLPVVSTLIALAGILAYSATAHAIGAFNAGILALLVAGLLAVIANRLARRDRPLIDRVTQDGWRNDRGALHVADVVVSLVVFAAIMLLAPTFYKFIDMITGTSVGPLTQLLLSLAVPFLFIILILSIGRQARRGGRV